LRGVFNLQLTLLSVAVEKCLFWVVDCVHCVTVGDLFWGVQRRKSEDYSQWHRHSWAC